MKEEMVSEKQSKAFWILKALAALSVIAAHVTIEASQSEITALVTDFWFMFGTVGVVTFFICSGFFSAYKTKTGKKFWLKKCKNIVAPWIFCGLITYVLAVFLGRPLSITECFNWIIGHFTWFYYVTVLLTLYMLLPILAKYRWCAWLAVGVNVFMLTLQTFHVPMPLYNEPITPYQDVLNWIGYFSLGILIRQYGWLPALTSKRAAAWGALIALTSLFIGIRLDLKGYFNVLTILWTLSSCLVLWNFSVYFAGSVYSKAAVYAGQCSYCIYLLHIQILQGTTRHLGMSLAMCITRPLIGMALFLLLIYIGEQITDRIPYGDRLQKLVGLKR